MSDPYDPELLPSLVEMGGIWSTIDQSTGCPVPPARLSLWTFLEMQHALDDEAAYAWASLFWPEFVEVDGAVILIEHFERANFDQWMTSFDGDVSRVEKVINHIDLISFFKSRNRLAMDRGVLRRVAQVMASCWRVALSEAFPDRQFSVAHYFDAESEQGDPWGTLTFFSER